MDTLTRMISAERARLERLDAVPYSCPWAALAARQRLLGMTLAQSAMSSKAPALPKQSGCVEQPDKGQHR